jgi:hypothetical protein
MLKTGSLLALLVSIGLLPYPANGQELTAKEIIRKADERFNGEKSSIHDHRKTYLGTHPRVQELDLRP